ncbi:MAG: D-alanyl-D-alanine carboxypeptidase/D-alanyl-D-alanine-endopeptidase [Proteobacteria bacterium]|nr:D-alanyl-D-alanine carboxypeptidase/D-alanyl-D-alanine-endopeptidase [Pseudomonadota bacterium]
MTIHRISLCRSVALLAACLIAAPVLAESGERLPRPVAQALQSAGIPRQSVALVVQEAATGQTPRVRINAAQPFNPASLMKLLTTYAALELLGPGYTWKTEAWTHGKLSEGVLEGDLVLKGGGDPKLSFEQFWLLLRQLRARGLREIRGDLVLDRSRFDTAATNDAGAEIFDDQPLRPYNVAPDALLLNFKALRLQFVPNLENKSLALLIEPQPSNLDIVNLIRPGLLNEDCGNWKEALRADLTYHNQRARLILSGTYALACGEKNWNRGVLSHPQYVEGVFRQLWQELGGTLSGSLREAGLPADARRLASSVSPPLAEVIRDINKFSNNVMARQLFLTLGSELAAVPGRGEDSARVIRAWLMEKQLSFPEMVLENGSGLSRGERISADSLARLLQAAWKGPLMPEFVASLPLTSVDGTMKKRLNQSGIAGQAHIKTGSLEGVRSLAGYVLDRAGRRWIVVFFVNHPNAAAAQPAQDALLQWVYERGGA